MQTGRHQHFGTELMVMGHVHPKAASGVDTGLGRWAPATPGGAMHVGFKVTGTSLELATGHPAVEFG